MKMTSFMTVFGLAALAACTSATSTEYGKLLGTFTDTAYGVAGTIYVIDARRIWLRGFSYNGQGPDAFFYVGSTDSPSGDGVIVPNENGQTSVLGAYSDRNFILTLPEDITTYKWFSVWCRQAGANFGDISIPADFVAPAPVDLGSFGFDPKVHDVSATKVTILNTKQVKFTNLVYDGQGPEAFFWVGDGNVPMAGGKRVPHVDDDNGVKLRGYTGEDVIVTLEGTDRIFNFGYISIWCAQALQDFGNAVIPADLNVPPYVASDNPSPIMPELPNCKVLKEDRFHIWWKVDEAAGKLRLRFEGTVKRDEYMSFGISGSQTGTSMPKSDVIVAYIGEDGEAGAMDYYLQSRSQCVPTNGDGACPDVLMDSTGAAASNDVTLLSSTVNRGITIIDVERPLAATDAKDKAIALAPTYVSWAIGELNPEKRVSKHSLLPRGDVQVDFSQESSSCPRLAPPAGDKVVTPWVIDDLTPEPAPEVITAHIGPSGGEQGYQGIAGQVGWGIAWYLNGLLVPVLNVKRNNTYKFEIYGGNDNSTNLANFHPFYITSDSDGGYNQKTAKGKEAETIYAGPTGGELCDFTSMADPKDFDTFEKYAETLNKTCPPMVKPGILEWTVDPETPDVVYYQCYQHRYFGWKINVSGASQTAVSFALMVALLALAVFNQI